MENRTTKKDSRQLIAVLAFSLYLLGHFFYMYFYTLTNVSGYEKQKIDSCSLVITHYVVNRRLFYFFIFVSQ